MLSLEIDKELELWDEQAERFIHIPKQTLTFEHSLVSISKWEAEWEKPFLTKEKKSKDEMIDYLRCMCLNKNVPRNTFIGIAYDKRLMSKINAYIEKPMTATKFKEIQKSGSRGPQSLTSERIYYLMIAFNIPFECQKWHLNRLFTLIEVCDRKNTPPKKMSRSELLKARYIENEARKKAWHTRG